MDIIRDIIINLAFLFAFLFLISFAKMSLGNRSWKNMIFRGFLFGMIAVGIMTFPVILYEGAIFDTRSVLISVVSLVATFPTALVATVIAIIYRIIIGGVGVYAGILSIFFSFAIGILWKRYIFNKVKMPMIVNLLLFGLFVHIFVLVSQLTFPYPLNFTVLRTIYWIYLTVYPIAVAVIALAIFRHEDNLNAKKQLEDSEINYRTMFNLSPLGMIQFDVNGLIIAVNDKFAEMLEVQKEQLIGLDMHQLPNKKGVSALESALKGNIVEYEGFYKSIFSQKEIYGKIHFSPLHSSNKLMGGLAIIEDMTQLIEDKERINDLIQLDILTRVYNRRSFDIDIHKKINKKNLPIAFITCDINTFQIVNESFGYEYGNEILVKLATILDAFSDKHVRTYRTGGDEFTMYLDNTDSKRANEILAEIKHEIDLINEVIPINLTVSFGISVQEVADTNLSANYTKALNDMAKNKIYDGSSFTKATIDMIMTAVFDKSKREERHSQRVGSIASKLAKELNLGTAFYNKVALAGKLHDIGKINIATEILDKPGKLDDLEWSIMKKHPESGSRILGSVPEYLEIAGIVLSHHERWDGFGYPHKLKEHDIPLASRVIALADSYDAMTEYRPYRRTFNKEEAIEEIRRCSGTQFDPELVEIFIDKVIDKI